MDDLSRCALVLYSVQMPANAEPKSVSPSPLLLPWSIQRVRRKFHLKFSPPPIASSSLDLPRQIIILVPRSSFIAPEGSYQLLSHVHFPPPAYPGGPIPPPADPHSSVSSSESLPPLPPAPPTHSSSFDLVTIHYPAATSTDQKTRGRRQDTLTAPDTAAGHVLSSGNDIHETGSSSSSASPQDSLNNPPLLSHHHASSSHSAQQPHKRRPLVSLTSFSGLSSLPSGSNSAASSNSRPRNGFRNSTSTFIKSAENMPLNPTFPKMRQWETNDVIWAMWTSGKTVTWGDIVPQIGRGKEMLARVHFSVHPTAVAINKATASSDRLDVAVGFASGDIVWFGKGSWDSDFFCTRPQLI
jgi:hypothetical protein